METSLVIQEEMYVPALVKAKGDNYMLNLPSGQMRKLERDKHFGNPKGKNGSPVFPQPILYKGGAELIIHDYKVFPRYELTCAIRDPENGFFYYEIKCSLVAINPANGQEIVVNEGVGNGNTKEGKAGTANGFDQANSAMKSAKKRAMVDAAINLAGLSTIFTQDLENEAFQKAAMDMVAAKDDDLISAKQRQRVFSIASMKGWTDKKTRDWLKVQGYASVKEVQQKDYDALCEKLEQEGNDDAV